MDQVIERNYALYCGDACELLAGLPDDRIGLSIYSPPFTGLYHYSSSERDLSNCDSYEQFFEHYGYIIRELYRSTMPGRVTAVHCADVRHGNTGSSNDYLVDFTGDIIRAHEAEGWRYGARYCVWKEPLAVRMRTLAKGLAHQTIVEDSTLCDVASADYLLVFRKRGKNLTPVRHPTGFTSYAGSRQIPSDVLRYRNWEGKQTENRYSHWIWRQYASAFWDDVRVDRVLPFRESREEDDERHVHPLQLDVIERIITLWSNPGEVVLTPFMGVGSEVYGAVQLGRRGIGIELKQSYFRQAVANLRALEQGKSAEQQPMLFDLPVMLS